MTTTTTVRPAPVFADDTVTVHRGDLRHGLRTFDITPGTVAAVVTSPPYNVGLGYDDYDDTLPWGEYRDLADDTATMAAEALCDGGRGWVNVAPVVPAVPGLGRRHHSGYTTKDRVSLLDVWHGALTLAGLAVFDVVAWVSEREPATAWGSWQTPAAPNLRGGWEAMLVASKGPWGRATPDEWQGWQDTVGGWPRLASNVWRIRPADRTPSGHPAPMPVEVAARCIRLSTWPGETVLDPFCGSGTTLDAARQLGRRGVGIDQSDRYCTLAAGRLAQGTWDFGGVA